VKILQLPALTSILCSLYSLGADPTENTASKKPSIIFMGGRLAIAPILLTCILAVTNVTHVASRDRYTATALHATVLIYTVLLNSFESIW
jgi:hypothetical protein